MTAITLTAVHRQVLRLALRSAATDPSFGQGMRALLAETYSLLADFDGLPSKMIIGGPLPACLTVQDSMQAIGDLARGVVERINSELHGELAETERAAADLGDRMAKIGGAHG